MSPKGFPNVGVLSIEHGGRLPFEAALKSHFRSISSQQVVKSEALAAKGRADKPLLRRKSDLPHNPSTARALEHHKPLPNPAAAPPRLGK